MSADRPTFGSMAVAYYERQKQRLSSELRDQTLLLGVAIEATLGENEELAQAVNKFVDHVRQGGSAKEFLNLNPGYASIPLGGVIETTNIFPINDTYVLEKTSQVGPVEKVNIADKLKQLCETNKAISELFFNDEYWVRDGGSQEVFIGRKNIELLLTPQNGQRAPKGAEVKMSILAKKWERDHGNITLGKRLVNRGRSIYLSREQAGEFIVWLSVNPKLLGEYTFSDIPISPFPDSKKK